MAQPIAKHSSSSSTFLKKEKISRPIEIDLNGHRPSFDLFWAAYPKKEGKGACRRWWQQHKPDDVLVGIMLAKLDQAKQTSKWNEEEGRFIPMPLTWLNQERWEDEYQPP